MDYPLNYPMNDLEQLLRKMDCNVTDENETLPLPVKISFKGPKWYGIDRGDGRYRLYRKLNAKRHSVPTTKSFPGKITKRRGKLITSFSRSELIDIAWSVNKSDNTYAKFVSAHENANKRELMSAVWSELNSQSKILSD